MPVKEKEKDKEKEKEKEVLPVKSASKPAKKKVKPAPVLYDPPYDVEVMNKAPPIRRGGGLARTPP